MLPVAEKVYLLPALQSLCKQWRSLGDKIVFSNGCFDILHPGHVDYLEKAAALGEKLIVGINTDRSVSYLKGPQRPISSEYSRSYIIAALQFVDAVILFDEDTPLNLIKQLKPDVLVKGNDYSISNIVGADFVINSGGSVKTIDLVQGYSTTKIIERIKQNI